MVGAYIPLECFRLQGDRLLVGRIILVSGEIFLIFMIMNQKKTANVASLVALKLFSSLRVTYNLHQRISGRNSHL